MSRKVTGKVVGVDSAGNLITDITIDRLADAPRDESLRVIIDEHETFGIFPSDHGQPTMTLVAIASDGEPLKISLVGDNASTMLGVQPGTAVSVEW